MKRFVLPALALALIPAAANAQTVEVSGSVQVGAPAPVPPPPPAPVVQPVYVQPQPQPVYVQQPVYGQPVQPAYIQPAYGYGRRMRVVPYNGGPIPPGATLRTQRRSGLIVGGAVMFGVSYLTTLIAAVFCTGSCAGGNGWSLYIPVAGPLIAAASYNSGSSYYSSSLYSSYLALGLIDTLVQAGGLAMLIAGAAATRQELVLYGENRRPERPRLAFVPAAPNANLLGASLAGSF